MWCLSAAEQTAEATLTACQTALAFKGSVCYLLMMLWVMTPRGLGSECINSLSHTHTVRRKWWRWDISRKSSVNWKFFTTLGTCRGQRVGQSLSRDSTVLQSASASSLTLYFQQPWYTGEVISEHPEILFWFHQNASVIPCSYNTASSIRVQTQTN